MNRLNWQNLGLLVLSLAWPGAVCAAAGQSAQYNADLSHIALADGPFKPDWDSLKQYQNPEWFRDAKFGIWAHWTAQCVPEEGDWYARHIYEFTQVDKKTGKVINKPHTNYLYHLAHYGHPSQFGFKDIDNLWKVDKWQPEKLMALYKRVGAKYFVALANHHDNFDCYDSKYQPWNSINMGPKKDIVGLWAKAARENGLRFGVTVHAARAWSWFEVAQGSDSDGPFKGVPYDGKLTKADGKGKWWEGYDPQDLYAQNHTPGAKPDQAYIEKFFLRTKDLIDKYQPDLLYFDDGVMPLNGVSDAGLRIAAHLYNSSMKWHQGRNEAVMNTKGLNEQQRQCLVWDIERGVSERVEPFVWQTDTCIGSWHYNRHTVEQHKYKTPAIVIHMLVDIVSKNGNLLLNVPVRGDGTIDDQEVECLEGVARWMAINNECIFGTRPWITFGEGPTRPGKNRFGGLSDTADYTAADFRFTSKGDVLYATALGWPENGKVLIRSLAKGADKTGKVTGVKLLGHAGELQWKQGEEGLAVSLPAQKPCEEAWVFKITGENMRDFKPVAPAPEISAPATLDAKGGVLLTPENAQIHGQRLKAESRGGKANLGFWDKSDEWVSWPIKVAEAGTFVVKLEYATTHPSSELNVEFAGQNLAAKLKKTGGWDAFEVFAAGQVKLGQAGEQTLSLKPRDKSSWKAINLRAVKLEKAP